jgi:hypothetical protein
MSTPVIVGLDGSATADTAVLSDTESGTYGICQQCGCAITADRMRARPTPWLRGLPGVAESRSLLSAKKTEERR